MGAAVRGESFTEIGNEDFHSFEEQLEMRIPSIQSCSSSKSKVDQDFFQSRASTTELCRICHDLDTCEDFLSPCYCKGSVSFVHRSCLERWLAESDSTHCELCGFFFSVQRFPKYGVFQSVITWLTSSATWRERRNLLVDLVALLFVSPVVFVTTFLAYQLLGGVLNPELDLPRELDHISLQLGKAAGRSVEAKSQIVNDDRRMVYQTVGGFLSSLSRMGLMALIVTVDMAYISWITFKIQYHVDSWYHWYRRNCKVTLTLNQGPCTTSSSAGAPAQALTA